MSKGVRGFYIVTDFIKEQLLNDVNVNTVSYGEIQDINLKKQDIYPLSHLNVVAAIPLENAIQFTVTVIAMDLVDESKEEVEETVEGSAEEAAPAPSE